MSRRLASWWQGTATHTFLRYLPDPICMLRCAARTAHRILCQRVFAGLGDTQSKLGAAARLWLQIPSAVGWQCPAITSKASSPGHSGQKGHRGKKSSSGEEHMQQHRDEQLVRALGRPACRQAAAQATCCQKKCRAALFTVEHNTGHSQHNGPGQGTHDNQAFCRRYWKKKQSQEILESLYCRSSPQNYIWGLQPSPSGKTPASKSLLYSETSSSIQHCSYLNKLLHSSRVASQQLRGNKNFCIKTSTDRSLYWDSLSLSLYHSTQIHGTKEQLLIQSFGIRNKQTNNKKPLLSIGKVFALE